MSAEFLNALEAYAKRLGDGAELSPETFSALFAEGVTIHSLSDEQIAELFSASRPTANRWRNGKATPALGYRKMIIKDLVAMTEKRIRQVRKAIAKSPGSSGGVSSSGNPYAAKSS